MTNPVSSPAPNVIALIVVSESYEIVLFLSLSLFFCFELWLSDFLLGCWFHKMVLGFAYDSYYLRWLGNMGIELKSPTNYYR